MTRIASWITLLAVACSLATPVTAQAADVIHADVLVGAGHEGRPESCKRFPKHKCNLGTAGERTLTPQIANEVAQILKARGLSVIRVPADFDGQYDVKDAVFIHFDGSAPACSSGASIGYHNIQDQNAAAAWRALYTRYWGFQFRPDNITDNLRDYYAFRQVRASDAALVLELGELTCPAQATWLLHNLPLEADLIARFLLSRLRESPGGLPRTGLRVP